MKADSNYQKALEFAPILWFADKEEYFPTMPFFSAFDNVNNDRSSVRVDFDDPQEIASTEEDESALKDPATNLKLISWKTLDAWYNQLETEADSIAFVKTLQSERDTLRAAIESAGKIEKHLINVLEEMPSKGSIDSSQSSRTAKENYEQRRRIVERFDYFHHGRRNLMRQLDSLEIKLRQLSEKPDLSKTEVRHNAKKRQSVVFYNVTKSFKARDLKDKLYSDEQFWHRLRDKHRTYVDYLEKEDAELSVYEYYFYYINDKGLQGHPEDIERVLVFVPQVDSIHFRVVVAPGHSNLVPNNVLFYQKDEVKPRYGSHLHILVELGGHSNAPDLTGNGHFEPGVDANWHVENIWGTRDIQAIAGSGAVNRYASWMTFPRDASNKVYPPDEKLTESTSGFCYKLLPIRNFKYLDSLLDQYAKLKATLEQYGRKEGAFSKNGKSKIVVSPDQKRFVGMLDSTLSNTGLDSTGLSELASRTLDPEQYLESMRHFLLWRKDLSIGTETLTKIKSPKGRFHGLALWADSEFLHNKQFYFSQPEIRAAVLFRFKRVLPGVFELHAGYNAPKLSATGPAMSDRAPEIGVIYEKFYANWFSYYAGFMGYVERNHPDHVAYQIGVSGVIPFFYEPHHTLRRFRLRLGAVILGGGFADWLRFNLQLGFHCWPIPLTDRAYVHLKADKHKIWEHDDFGNPDQSFKKFLFRRRGLGLEVNSLGFWINWLKQDSPEIKLAYIIPAWDALPVKTDGVVEAQIGHPWPGFNSKADDWRWTLSLYYERLYGRLLSWYLNISCRDVSHLTINDFGGGLSIMYPWLAGKRFPVFKNRYCPPWIHLRLGLRSAINKEPLQFSPPRLELQLGFH